MLKLRPALYTLRQIISTGATRRASLKDLRLPENGYDSNLYLEEAVGWLCRAQDAGGGGGVSYGFDLREGWLPPYPETTGYIIPTFLRYARVCESQARSEKAEALRKRAERMAEWLTTTQMECGAIPGGTIGREAVPTVFNTGQVLQGWCHAYREFQDETLKERLVRAARWMVSVQDDDGCWRKGLSPLTLQTPATYNVRSAAALLEAGFLLDDAGFKNAAVKNFDWALSEQSDTGWFANNCLTDNRRPLTHTIGYTLEGLLDAAQSLNDERYFSAVARASGHLKRAVADNGFLSGRFDTEWRPQVSWNCLTGSCQIALVWFRLSEASGEREYTRLAEKILSFVKRTQRHSPIAATTDSENTSDGISGGIKGSHPVWGGYDPFRYPNWAAKFFVDALLASGFKE
ncbi:MAG: hypothetical protein L0229_03760 [Blastocatellia bacterium]|nr:hypothetical protein [Blastocatellia bacterium]